MMGVFLFAYIFVSLLFGIGKSTEIDTRQSHFIPVDTDDVSSERELIQKISSTSEFTCSQKCLWHERCRYTKYDAEGKSCDLLHKFSKEDLDSDCVLSKREQSLPKTSKSFVMAANDVITNTPNCVDKAGYQSCTQALSANNYKQAVYQICPPTLPAPLPVECMRDNGRSVAVFHHDNENTTLVNGSEAEGSYKRSFGYNISLGSIISVINKSRECEQYTVAKCYGSVFERLFSRYTWLSDRSGKKLKYWGGGPSDGEGCACGVNQTCAMPSIRCNCDKNDFVWRSDEGFIREKNVLPITAINVGDTGSPKEMFIYTVSALICVF